MSEFMKAVILGIVEGVTEYLPVSSTGHLILFGEALEFTGDKAKSFEVMIQSGAILAVVILYRHRFVQLFDGLFDPQKIRDRGLRGSAGITKLMIATLPALAIGFVFRKWIKAQLFSPLPVAVALAVGGVVMIVIERLRQTDHGEDVEDLTLRQAFLIGCVQCFALWPGMSRSASAIIGGLFVGLNRRAAAEFSFLAAVPILAAASAADLVSSYKTLTANDLGLLAIGFVVSFVTALATVKVFISLVSRMTLAPFGWYRIAVAAIVIALVMSGTVETEPVTAESSNAAPVHSASGEAPASATSTTGAP